VKKSLFIILAVVMMVGSFVLAGCSKQTTTTATVTATATATTTATTTVKPMTLIFQSMDPEDSVFGRVFVPWFADLEKQSGGRVKVEAHWNGELVSMPEIYDATVKGTLDIATQMAAMPAGRFPMDEIEEFTSYEVQCYRYSTVKWELNQEFPEMRAPYSDVKVITCLATFPIPLGTTKKWGPVSKLEDNKGMKELGYGEWQVARGEALGRTAVSLLPPDTYSSLEKGVIDGMSCFMGLFESAKFGEVLPYITMVPGPISPWNLIMNLNKWNSLPTDVQQYIDNSSAKLAENFDIECLKVWNDALVTYPKEFGTQFIYLTPEEQNRWTQAEKPVFDKFVASLNDTGLPGTKLMAEFQQLEKKYAAPEYALK
jgi:TRAP-type C4-dicarboxylate transport system substrate-binding protein